jgi:hypothetical protein
MRRLLFIGIPTAVLVLTGTTFYALGHGYEIPKYVSDDPSSASSIQQSAACRQKQKARDIETAPLQKQRDEVNNQINAIGQQLSSYRATGLPPISTLELAQKYVPSQVPILTELGSQYIDLQNKIDIINQKYGC